MFLNFFIVIQCQVALKVHGQVEGLQRIEIYLSTSLRHSLLWETVL